MFGTQLTSRGYPNWNDSPQFGISRFHLLSGSNDISALLQVANPTDLNIEDIDRRILFYPSGGPDYIYIFQTCLLSRVSNGVLHSWAIPYKIIR